MPGEIVDRVPAWAFIWRTQQKAHHVIVIAGEDKADAIVAVVGNHQRIC